MLNVNQMIKVNDIFHFDLSCLMHYISLVVALSQLHMIGMYYSMKNKVRQKND